jgi:hypothetical protein
VEAVNPIGANDKITNTKYDEKSLMVEKKKMKLGGLKKFVDKGDANKIGLKKYK